jgi:hypothetical protein
METGEGIDGQFLPWLPLYWLNKLDEECSRLAKMNALTRFDHYNSLSHAR